MRLIDDALAGACGLMNDQFGVFPMPRNVNYLVDLWRNPDASSSSFSWLTGIVLAMHYVPHESMAFDSVEHIMRDVNWGWLLRYMHANGASMFFLAVYIHILRGLYYGSYKSHRAKYCGYIGVFIYVWR